MTGFRCRTLRASLVDFAEGQLEEPLRGTIERHVTTCTDCAAAVLSLREVPSELRRLAAPEPAEEHWARQRERIMAAIEDSRGERLVKRRVRSRTLPWAQAGALAASLAAIVLLSRWGSVPLPLERAAPDQNSPEVVAAADAPVFAEELIEPEEAALAMSESEDELDFYGDLFEDTTI